MVSEGAEMNRAHPIKDKAGAPGTGAPKTKTPGAVAAAPGAGTLDNQHDDCAATDDGARKVFASLQAHAAMQGWRLDALHDVRGRPCYVLHRWGRAIDCTDIDAVRAALVRMGCAP